jgi:hypothetical protein
MQRADFFEPTQLLIKAPSLDGIEGTARYNLKLIITQREVQSRIVQPKGVCVIPPS